MTGKDDDSTIDQYRAKCKDCQFKVGTPSKWERNAVAGMHSRTTGHSVAEWTNDWEAEADPPGSGSMSPAEVVANTLDSRFHLDVYDYRDNNEYAVIVTGPGDRAKEFVVQAAKLHDMYVDFNRVTRPEGSDQERVKYYLAEQGDDR